MKKIEKCPKCDQENPALTLQLLNAERYTDDIPDNRVYALICLACGNTIEEFTVDNTLKAVKALRDEMNQLYGKSEIRSSYLW